MKIPNRKYGNGVEVFVSIISANRIIKDASWNGLTWLYSFENEEMSAGEDYLQPPVVFASTTPAKCLVELSETDNNGVTAKIVRPFASELEFLFYWQNKANFGFQFPETAEYKILSPEEVAAFLLPLQMQIVANEKKKAEAKKVFEDSARLAKQMVDFTGFGFFFQDAAGIVYKTNLPEWKSQKIEHQEIQRTRYEGEAKGSLSMPEARQAGFVVEGEGAKAKKEKTSEQTLSGEF